MSSQKVSDEPAIAEPAAPVATRRSPATAVLQRLGEGVFGLLFAALLVLILASIVGRNIGHGLPWWVDAAQLLFVYLALTGGVVSYATGDAIAFTEVVRRLPRAVSEAAGGVTVGAVLGLSVIECYASTQAMLAVQGQVSTIAGIPSVLYAAPFAVAFLLWALIGLVRTARMVRHPLSVVGVLVGIAIVALPYLVSSSDGPSTTQALGFAFVIMLVLLLVGTPLAFVLLSGAYLTNALAAFSSQQLPIDLVSATGDILLLAIPFFIFVGYLLTDGSLSRPLTKFFDALVGHLPGGKNLVALISMFVFSGISGSKIADVAAVSVSLRGILDEEFDDVKDDKKLQAALVEAERLESGHRGFAEGVRPGDRAGLLCGAAVAGETIPPSLVLLVLGSVTSLSITKLFLAGIVPHW